MEYYNFDNSDEEIEQLEVLQKTIETILHFAQDNSGL